jgi:NAD(P)-dependent dehydrogenase (short-subunit alcohol dehydrogenase family)
LQLEDQGTATSNRGATRADSRNSLRVARSALGGGEARVARRRDGRDGSEGSGIACGMKIAGQLAIVTGANTGIGRVTAVELAKRGARVVLACRSEERAAPVVEEIARAGGQAEFLRLDLADLAATRVAAEALLARRETIPLLVNNAGLAGAHGLTKDGFEIAFGTNHLGPFLFTQLLLPAIERAPEARIVNVASAGHRRVKGIPWDAVRKPTQTTTAFPEYCVSKLANVLFSAELARRVKSHVRTYSLHPGAVATDVWREVPWGVRHVMKLLMLSNEQGARTQIWCATSDEVAGQTGLYYDSCRVKTPSAPARDAGLARELWERSEAWVGFGAGAPREAAKGSPVGAAPSA